MESFWKVIQVIFLSSVKFAAGPPFAYFGGEQALDPGETFFFCLLGGMLGVLLFTYVSAPILRIEKTIVRMIRAIKKQKPDKETKKRIFTPRNRRIVRIWTRYGLSGIAFLTPVLLSIPIGTLVANHLVHNKRKIIAYMFVSLLFWSIVLTTAFAVLHVNSMKELKEQVSE
ncbi:MAG: hypothetical protein ACKOQY_09270 [Bacteroidota bacterium]